MTKRSLFTAGLMAATVFTGIALSGCADDGYDRYDRGYTSMSIGVTSSDYDRPYHHHHGWGDRDYDGDGVPNRFDDAPHNPYRY